VSRGHGADSFIYGHGETLIEQINDSTGTVTYLHHDQAGSTRLLTGSKEGSQAPRDRHESRKRLETVRKLWFERQAYVNRG
jgi:hypothetical protein